MIPISPKYDIGGKSYPHFIPACQAGKRWWRFWRAVIFFMPFPTMSSLSNDISDDVVRLRQKIENLTLLWWYFVIAYHGTDGLSRMSSAIFFQQLRGIFKRVFWSFPPILTLYIYPSKEENFILLPILSRISRVSFKNPNLSKFIHKFFKVSSRIKFLIVWASRIYLFQVWIKFQALKFIQFQRLRYVDVDSWVPFIQEAQEPFLKLKDFYVYELLMICMSWNGCLMCCWVLIYVCLQNLWALTLVCGIHVMFVIDPLEVVFPCDVFMTFGCRNGWISEESSS